MLCASVPSCSIGYVGLEEFREHRRGFAAIAGDGHCSGRDWPGEPVAAGCRQHSRAWGRYSVAEGGNANGNVSGSEWRDRLKGSYRRWAEVDRRMRTLFFLEYEVMPEGRTTTGAAAGASKQRQAVPMAEGVLRSGNAIGGG